MSDLTDRKLGDFHLLRHLGGGGMADVYLAEQTSLQRYVAVKVMKPSVMATSGQTMVARFRQEAMMAASLNHPNIIQVYMIGCEDNLHYIAQELVQGRDLAAILRERGKPDLPSALHIIQQVAAALTVSGQAGIVHRDIKPENIMVTRKGDVKVADFGLAQLHGSDDANGLTREGITMGTPLYMSPEQVSGKDLDPRTDIYSLGVTCYQLLCGEPPFTGSTPMAIALQHLNSPPPPLKEKNPKLPDILCRMVHRMMAKRRALRYQSAEEVLADVTKLSTAIKQGRSPDRIRLPRLEQLEQLAAEARAQSEKPAASPRELQVADGTRQPSDRPGLAATRAIPNPLPARVRPANKPVKADAVRQDEAAGRAEPVREAEVLEVLDVVEFAEDPVDIATVETAAPSDRGVLSRTSRDAISSPRSPLTTVSDFPADDDDPGYVPRKPASSMEEMDLTSMVDVTFQLLIFFMITASFSTQKCFDVPPARTADGATTIVIEESPTSAILVQVDRDNVVFVEGRRAADYAEVLSLLESEKGKAADVTDVDLRLDPDSLHEMRVLVIDAATQAGFQRIRNRIEAL